MKFQARWLLALAGSLSAAAPAETPPISAFISSPQIETVKLSPDGKYLAITKRVDDREVLSVIGYPDAQTKLNTNFGALIDIDDVEWVDDTRLLVQPARRFAGYRAYKVRTGEIISVNVETRVSELVFGFAAGQDQTGHLAAQRQSTKGWASILDFVPDDPNSMLIQVGGFTDAGRMDRHSNSVQRINVKSGRLSRIAGSPVANTSYITNGAHELQFATGYTDSGEFQAYLFKPENKSWQLLSSSAEDAGGIYPFETTATAGEYLAMDSRSTPTDTLVAWKPATDERRVLFHSDISDVNVAGADVNNHVWIYSYIDHYPAYWYPDPENPLARVHRGLRAGFKDANIYFTSMTRDGSMAVAEISSPTIPPTYYLVDVKNVKLLEKLASRPDLKTEDLSRTDPFEVKVRDGMKIRGYLTTPKGSSGKKMPMIVYVHGGPHGPFDSYDFDPEVQLLASRGYAVMQVNYRGSGGRGREFMEAGYRQWGRAMQDDVTDATQWAIAAGVADPARICIYGGSYGGYAALTGAFREPDLYKCVVGVAGVYDLTLMYEKGDIPEQESGLNYLHKVLGTDIDDLKSRSPLYNVDKIKAPVMLIHGKEDARVPIEHALRLREALTKAGKPPVWISEAGEEHGIFGEEHRTVVYEQMLAFFAKYLGTGAPAKAN